jgi:hypothetical protein
MRLDNDSDELSQGRLFIHGRLNDPMTGGPLYCRVLSFDAAWVEYEPIYHREDGSERLRSPPGAADRGLPRGNLRRLVPGDLATAGHPGREEDRDRNVR